MNRYTSYLEGMDIVDIAEDESGYDYYGFNRWGSEEWCIKKVKTDFSEVRFIVGNKDYTTNWSGRGSLTNWKRPSEIG